MSKKKKEKASWSEIDKIAERMFKNGENSNQAMKIMSWYIAGVIELEEARKLLRELIKNPTN